MSTGLRPGDRKPSYRQQKESPPSLPRYNKNLSGIFAGRIHRDCLKSSGRRVLADITYIILFCLIKWER